jgi:Domain of unknown function (DUF5664)
VTAPNPKDIEGRKKPGFDATPIPALRELAKVHENGAAKYGRLNWREHPVLASVYYNAAMRHLLDWMEGQDADFDSMLHPLAHVMACCAVVIDAQKSGKLIDDRPKIQRTYKIPDPLP